MVSYLGIVPWLEALLEMKRPSIADVLNERDEGGLVALDWAAEGQNERAVEVLLKYGSNISNESRCCGQALLATKLKPSDWVTCSVRPRSFASSISL